MNEEVTYTPLNENVRQIVERRIEWLQGDEKDLLDSIEDLNETLFGLHEQRNIRLAEIRELQAALGVEVDV